MSLRDNLQHLRASRNMTQEQLAMLLGISRQSVTKWEAEKSYPEMDKLIKLCQLFECTLDELVTGDLTGRPVSGSAAAPVVVPAGPPTDVCGYDEHMRRFARSIALGVPFFILSSVPTILADAAAGSAGDSQLAGLGLLFFFALIAVGLAFVVPAGVEHAAFVREHPYVEDFYTADDKARARRLFSRGIVAGAALILLGVTVSVACDGTPFEEASPAALLAIVAVVVGVIVWVSMGYARVNVAAYNREAVEDVEPGDLASASIPDELREQYEASAEHNRKTSAICGIIMLVVTIVGVVWLFVSPDQGGGPSDARGMFWLSWVVGGIACAIVSLFRSAFRR